MHFFITIFYNSYFYKLICKLFSNIQADYKKLGFSSRFFINSIIKLSLIIDYYITYFLLYNPIGIILVFLSGFLLAILEQGDPLILGHISFIIYFGGLGCILPLCFLIQYNYFKNILQDIIGVEDFNSYLGENTGSRAMIKAAAGFGSAVVVGVIVHGINGYVQQDLDTNRLKEYKHQCQEAGISPNPLVLDKFGLERPKSVLETILHTPMQIIKGKDLPVESPSSIDTSAEQWRLSNITEENSSTKNLKTVLPKNHPAQAILNEKSIE